MRVCALLASHHMWSTVDGAGRHGGAARAKSGPGLLPVGAGPGAPEGQVGLGSFRGPDTLPSERSGYKYKYYCRHREPGCCCCARAERPTSLAAW